MVNLALLEEQYNNKLQQIKDNNLQVPIYRTRRSRVEPDLTFYATDPLDNEFIIYNNETLQQMMVWCEKQGFRYKFMPNCGNLYV